MINCDPGTFEFDGQTWEYRWIHDNGLRVAPYERAVAVDGVYAAGWPSDGLVSVVIGRRVQLLEAREVEAGLEAIYAVA